MGINAVNRMAVVAHWIIMALCVYAVFCCGFHLLPAWGDSENYESINATWLSIALSYIAGYVIYLFTSALPRRQRGNEVFAIWEPYLTSNNSMTELIEEICVFADIPKEKLRDLKVEDCEVLQRYTAMPLTIWIHKDIIRDDPEQPLRVNADFDIKRNLNGHHDAMKKAIGVMLNNPMAVDADKRILDLLSRIKESSFLAACTSIIAAPIVYDGVQVNITTADLPKYFVEYVKLRDELSKLPIHKYVYTMRKLTDEEVLSSMEAAKKELAKMGLTLEQEGELSQKITNASRKV